MKRRTNVQLGADESEELMETFDLQASIYRGSVCLSVTAKAFEAYT